MQNSDFRQWQTDHDGRLILTREEYNLSLESWKEEHGYDDMSDEEKDRCLDQFDSIAVVESKTARDSEVETVSEHPDKYEHEDVGHDGSETSTVDTYAEVYEKAKQTHDYENMTDAEKSRFDRAFIETVRADIRDVGSEETDEGNNEMDKGEKRKEYEYMPDIDDSEYSSQDDYSSDHSKSR